MNFAAKVSTLLVLVAIVGLVNCQDDQVTRGPSKNAKAIEGSKYSVDNLQALFLQDLMRWMTIGEDVLAEFITRTVLDGVLDKKSVKIALRFLLQKAKTLLNQNGLDTESYGF